MNDFKNKTLRQIKWWVWIAALAPMSALAGLFFIWKFGTDSWISVAFILVETAVFIMVVLWWWWAMHVIKTLVNTWSDTGEKVKEISTGIREVRNIVKEMTTTDK
jgi:hypothetical protein